MSAPTEDQTLGEAKDWLRERLHDGACCPLCTQFAKIYRRKINSGMARALIALYRASLAADDLDATHHLASLARWTHEGAQLAWWGLIEQDPDERREDGGRSSWYRLTATGVWFVRDQIRLPKYVEIYDGLPRKLDLSEQASIVDALGTKFDYRELMEGL
jgi:hypothetical protein